MRFAWLLVCVWMMGAGALGTTPKSTSEGYFSSNEHPEIFLSIWSFWHKSPDGWVFLITGDYRDNKGLTVWKWPEGEAPVQWAQTSAREGIFLPKLSALSPSGNTLSIRGLRSPIIFELDMQTAPVFQRKYQLEHAESMLFWEEDRLFSGGKYPQVKFKFYGQNQIQVPLVKSLPNLLPKDMDHPIESQYSQNQMVLAKHGESLAVGIGMYHEVMVWNGVKKRYFHIGFPGYQKPPWRKLKRMELPQFRKWLATFHHLFQLTWFQGDLYGLFRQGGDDDGTWVKFVGGGCVVVWDNNREPVRLFAMEGDSLVFGEKVLDTEEEIKWRLWQASSLPSRLPSRN